MDKAFKRQVEAAQARELKLEPDRKARAISKLLRGRGGAAKKWAPADPGASLARPKAIGRR